MGRPKETWVRLSCVHLSVYTELAHRRLFELYDSITLEQNYFLLTTVN